MQTVKVNGQVIPEEAIQFELERLVRFYTEHGVSQEQIRAQLQSLLQKATDQAIVEVDQVLAMKEKEIMQV